MGGNSERDIRLNRRDRRDGEMCVIGRETKSTVIINAK